jgi:hypothetical protein
MNCPACNKKLEYSDSLAFGKLSDYAAEASVHYIIGIIVSLVGFACYAWSELIGLLTILSGGGIFYYHLHQAKSIWQCKECNKKYVGKYLKPFTGY